MGTLDKNKQYFEDRAKALKSLKGKANLQPDEWITIVYETWAIAANHTTCPFMGGTRSSENLRVNTGHLELLKSGITQPEEFNCESPTLDELIRLTQENLEAAQVGVKRHNEQTHKFFGYDIETGLPIKDSQAEKFNLSLNNNGGDK